MYNSDIFVFLDDSQYGKNQVINRNKIKTAKGWTYLSVPVLIKGHFGQLISEVKIDNHINWRKKHWKSILYNYKKAHHFDDHSSFFEDLYQREWKKLSELNEYIIRNIAEFLDIKTKFIRSSELNIEGDATQWLVNIVKAVGGDSYFSGLQSKDYMEDHLFAENGIKLIYQDFHHPTYKQLFGEFIPKMSVIDLLYNEGLKSTEIIRGA
jgi:hypothetical protein